ncbi:sensor histidine kinase [Xanthomarina gelatinilytica]|uniref:sensor histidine kinase n=1 Tax=Xanthomarina gelatinilytica TaxID=1137281 RepID=UPI003AA90C0C
MLNIKQVKETINSVITKDSGSFQNSVVVKNTDKPHYNNGKNQFKICSINHPTCKEFYKENSSLDIWEKTCPFGFTVSKKSYDTSTSHQRISVFSILDLKKSNRISELLSNLPRKLKQQREDIVNQLNQISLDYSIQKTRKKYIEGLLETLLIGRIGLSIQSISHQFFTPLQGAMADLKNIQNGNDVDESTQRLSHNFSSLNKLATEIQLILSTSQEFNLNMLRRVPVHISVKEIFDGLSSSAEEKNISLNQGYNHYNKTVDAIPSQFHIVLSNIITNAIKYSFKGMPDNYLEVKVDYEQDDENLIISVINEGCKITHDEISLGLIFNLGYRGIYSGDRQRSGSGSGLYISQKIINAHGGKITVTSNFCGGNVEMETDRYRNKFSIHWPVLIE